jgi:hypothetical protein
MSMPCFTQPIYDTASINPKIIIGMTDLNADFLPDTIIGQKTLYSDYLPQIIKWGRDSTHTFQQDTSYFVYPSWTQIRGSFSVDDLNNDSLYDCIFILDGKVEESGLLKDTSLAVVIYGQFGIDSLMILPINLTSNLQTEGFIARRLRRNYELILPAKRNPLSAQSMIIPLLTDQVPKAPPTDSNEQNNILSTLQTKHDNSFSVFPVPSQSKITLQFDNEFEYQSLKIIDAAGVEITPSYYSISEKSKSSININIKNLPNGVYTIIVTDNYTTPYISNFVLFH